MEDETPVETLDDPAATHRNLLAHAQAHSAQIGDKAAEPVRVITPMLDQFKGRNRAFVRGRRPRG